MQLLNNYYNQIKNSSIFKDISESDLKDLLECFQAKIKNYKKNDFIIKQDDNITQIYLILNGEVNIEKDTYWGRRIIISKLTTNNNFALSYIGNCNIKSTINAIAIKDTTILTLEYKKCTNICQNACTKHKTLINNLFQILATENLDLIEKIENISQKTIREKLLTYLSNESIKQSSNKIKIHFNRQELADYLNIDRSAMSFELSKLQKEGFIKYDKNFFQLIKKNRKIITAH